MQTVTTADTSKTIDIAGGRFVLFAQGTWGSGTLTFTWSGDGGTTFLTIGSGASFTADGTLLVELPPGQLKGTLTGSTGATVQFDARRTRCDDKDRP